MCLGDPSWRKRNHGKCLIKTTKKQGKVEEKKGRKHRARNREQ